MNTDLSQMTPEHWKSLGLDLLSRLVVPLQYPTYVFYFLGSLVFLGGMGTWGPYFYSWMQYDAKDATPRPSVDVESIGIYLLVLIGTTLANLLIEEQSHSNKSFRGLVWLLIFTAGAHGVACILFPRMWIAVAGIAIGWLTWWLVNAPNTTLHDAVSAITAPTGGDATQQPNGNLEGIDS